MNANVITYTVAPSLEGEPFYSIVRHDGRVIALRLPNEAIANRIAYLLEIYGEGVSQGPPTVALKITDDPTSLRLILQEVINNLRGPEGNPPSRAASLAVTKLQEARFWLGEEMFGES